MITHKGYHIVTANSRGGKAGRGHAKTSTVQVREPMHGDSYLLKAQFRFTIGDDESLRQATLKALRWATDARLKARGFETQTKG